MHNKKRLTHILLGILLLTLLLPLPTTQAAPPGHASSVLTASTVPGSGGTGLIDKVIDLLFNKILDPILNVFGSKSSTADSPVKVTPLPPVGSDGQDSNVLQGKVIVIDPGHGGSNPGAVANNTRESDNNLAVGLKLRDKLRQAGAKVVMTRDTDRTVAPEGSTLDQELQARITIAEENQADIFVSIHSNDNDDPSIAGTMSFYPNGKSSALARAVQNAVVKETHAVNRGVSPANFYVLRNNPVPAMLLEMGFVSNPTEAARLHDATYRASIAQGIFNGIVNYFSSR
ncbi:n-acetylmuramoyl-l-alanine amidase [Lucifera butyrica]|uniref:N-acetylmuramoyl-l-alanine amidase n=1 Tax=Lucifera butyrica TaxID=1351585 RepID=A0A498RAP4_9FIRM|nr:N-acetylmuramoyl-L-alanine amidase [Lucifera butyrica]VBB08040.1 n-acetylmuramoyl-l-alanine amidase [Lucifera butyrica]